MAVCFTSNLFPSILRKNKSKSNVRYKHQPQQLISFIYLHRFAGMSMPSTVTRVRQHNLFYYSTLQQYRNELYLLEHRFKVSEVHRYPLFQTKIVILWLEYKQLCMQQLAIVPSIKFPPRARDPAVTLFISDVIGVINLVPRFLSLRWMKWLNEVIGRVLFSAVSFISDHIYPLGIEKAFIDCIMTRKSNNIKPFQFRFSPHAQSRVSWPVISSQR